MTARAFLFPFLFGCDGGCSSENYLAGGRFQRQGRGLRFPPSRYCRDRQRWGVVERSLGHEWLEGYLVPVLGCVLETYSRNKDRKDFLSNFEFKIRDPQENG